jgi:hypothetical protein
LEGRTRYIDGFKGRKRHERKKVNADCGMKINIPVDQDISMQSIGTSRYQVFPDTLIVWSASHWYSDILVCAVNV